MRNGTCPLTAGKDEGFLSGNAEGSGTGRGAGVETV
jgi:hypothetical protein